MTDTLTLEINSELMSSVYLRGNSPRDHMTSILRSMGMSYSVRPKGLPGNPDFVIHGIIGDKIALFIHSCFWHKCKKHFKLPKDNPKSWKIYIDGNVSRHAQDCYRLRRLGYRTAVVWEHSLGRNGKTRKYSWRS